MIHDIGTRVTLTSSYGYDRFNAHLDYSSGDTGIVTDNEIGPVSGEPIYWVTMDEDLSKNPNKRLVIVRDHEISAFEEVDW